MSDTQCQPGDTTGFPVKLSQSLYTNWPSTANPQEQIKKLIVPTDFTVQWGPPAQSAQVAVRQTVRRDGIPGVFQISGISTITDSTSLTYGNAVYKCSGVISIVQNQHPNFCQESNALYEAILAFQISNKSTNPSSPDVVLLCRPIIFSTWNSSTFWPAVDTACVEGKPQSVAVDLSTMYGYNSSLLMPMITYQSCIPVKLLNYNRNPYSYGSIRMRVHVVPQPIYMVASENGLGKCSIINKYTLVTSGAGPVSIFSGASGNTLLQFRDGFGKDLYPIQTTSENLVLSASPNAISAFTDILQKFEVHVPESFLGKSLAEISSLNTPPPVQKKKKAYKCYTIDPAKDVVGDQIMIDPTTGQRLEDTMTQEAMDAAGGDMTQTKYYMLYGSALSSTLRVQRTLAIPPQTSGISDLTAFISQDNDRVRIIFASMSDTTNVWKSISYIGKSSSFDENTLTSLDSKADLQTDDPGSVNVNVISINSLDIKF